MIRISQINCNSFKIQHPIHWQVGVYISPISLNLGELVTSIWNFPVVFEGKAPARNAGDLGSIPGSGRSPGEGSGNPLQDPCLEKSHERRSLVGYSPWGRKESDTTEQLHLLSVTSTREMMVSDFLI